MIVLDTSALFFWAFDPEKLTPAARQAIQEADLRIVNAISLWELGLKVQRRKLYLPITVREFAIQLSRVERLDIRPTDIDIWLHSLDLDWAHRDPADRVIVASADLLGCKLVTSDQRIRGFYPLTVW
ncbi:MAG: type II toxin-antitoxin system VapC family toxin [Chloroflexi bacterium]|nr:type II toxin-antitoxin system VapC family toxin [Chloroflexota bacterium]